LKIVAYRGVKQPLTKAAAVDVLATVQHYLSTDKVMLKLRSNISKAAMHIIFLIDSSGSMVKDQQIAYIKGLIADTIVHYKGKRILYAAVALSNGDAQLLSPFTLDTELVMQTIASLKSGGKTNMKAGLAIVHQLIRSDAHLYVFTDGKINAGTFEETVSYYKTHLKQVKSATVIDNDSGFIQLGLSQKLATAIGAKYNHINR
jgi:magnesium chelatase subunit D